jgi:glycosyltransferase involved in cell wall biosynthesis
MKSTRKKQSVVYINFSPYENTGSILDYLLNHFKTVLVFSFNFHKLSGVQSPSMLRIYRNGYLIHKNRLFQSPNTAKLALVLLPVRTAIIFAQIVYHLYRFDKKYGPFDIFFTINAFIAWIGMLLKKFHLVSKTIFWVWDYYPPIHKNKMIMLMRWSYWFFDEPASIYADRTVFLNNKMYLSRKKMGILPINEFAMVGIGTNPARKAPNNSLPIKLVFIGVIKQSQGLDIVFSSADKLVKTFPGITLTIIGGGPDEEYYRKLSGKSNLKTHFFGNIENQKKIRKLISKCHIGIAPYVPERGNVSYYGDPSKIKDYLSCGLPVLTTNVFDFSSEIQHEDAGIIIRYNNKSFINGIGKIMKKYKYYQRNALKIARKYYYSDLYDNIFK